MAITDNLVSYYKLDSNSNDSIGSNNGTDTSVSYVAGKIGNAGSFNGSTSYINIPDSTTLSFTNKICTWNFWFKTSSTTQACLISKMQSGNYEYAVYISNVATGKIYGTITDSAAGNLWGGYTNSAYNDGNWHMATFVFNNAQPVIYIDGSVASSTGSGSGGTNTDGTAPLRLGNTADNNNYYNGQLDEVGIWNRAITASEVTQLYNGGNGLSYPFGSNNSGFFQFFA